MKSEQWQGEISKTQEMKKLEDSKKKGKGIEEFKDKNVSILGRF